MVFVTVGNATQGFRRLLDTIEDLAGAGTFGSETVLIQSGNNHGFRTSHCIQEPFFPAERFVEIIRTADLVICHAGAGTLFHVLQSGKVPVVMPRRAQYGELVDDHQVELVRALALEGRIVPAQEPQDLPTAIASARQRWLAPTPAPPSRMLALVNEAVEELLEREGKDGGGRKGKAWSCILW